MIILIIFYYYTLIKLLTSLVYNLKQLFNIINNKIIKFTWGLNLYYLLFKFKLIISTLLIKVIYFNFYLLISSITAIINLIKLFN